MLQTFAPYIGALRDELVWLVVLGVGTFHALMRAQKKTLLGMLVMACLVGGAYVYLQRRITEEDDKEKTDDAFLKKDTAWRHESNFDAYFVAKFPKKGLRYLKESRGLLDIVKKMSFVRMFDRSRFGDMLLAMDRMQKTYMFILDGRYYAKTQVTNFLMLRDTILELMYSTYFVIPQHMQHVYGVSPHERIHECIEAFAALSRLMTDVLRSYMRKTLKEPHFPELLPSPALSPFDPIRNRRLP
jgi:hypothetical protein